MEISSHGRTSLRPQTICKGLCPWNSYEKQIPDLQLLMMVKVGKTLCLSNGEVLGLVMFCILDWSIYVHYSIVLIMSFNFSFSNSKGN